MFPMSCLTILSAVIATINCKIVQDRPIRNHNESWSQEFSNNWIKVTVGINETSLPNLKSLLDAPSIQSGSERNAIIVSFLRQVLDSVHIEMKAEELASNQHREGQDRALQLNIRDAVNKLNKFEVPFKTSRIQLFLGSMPISFADLLGGVATVFSAVATGLISAGLLTANLSKRESISRRNFNTKYKKRFNLNPNQYVPYVPQVNSNENYSPYSNHNNKNQFWQPEASIPVHYQNHGQIYNPAVQNYYNGYDHRSYPENARNNFDSSNDGSGYSSAKINNAGNAPARFLSPPAEVQYSNIPYKVNENLLNLSNSVYFSENQASSSHPDFIVKENTVKSIPSEKSNSLVSHSYTGPKEPTGQKENLPRNVRNDPSNLLEQVPSGHQKTDNHQFSNQHYHDERRLQSENNQVSSNVENLEKLIKSDGFPGFPYTFDNVLGPRLSRIDSIFQQLNFTDEECKRKMICSIYKNPNLYSPVSEMLSHQISIDVETLKSASVTTSEGQRFSKYLSSARAGSLGEDCDKNYAKCEINTKNLATYPMINTYNHINHLIRSGKPTLSS